MRSSEDSNSRRAASPVRSPVFVARKTLLRFSRNRLFLNSTSDARLLPLVLEAASGNLEAPADAEMSADEAVHGITPLFDGEALERI